MCALGFVFTYMERKILHQKIQMPAYWWLCTRQIVLGAQLAAIYVDVHSGIKSEKKYCYLPLTDHPPKSDLWWE